MILKLHQKSSINSVTTVIDDRGFENSKIPFPAVTIFSSYPKPPTAFSYARNDGYKSILEYEADYDYVTIFGKDQSKYVTR